MPLKYYGLYTAFHPGVDLSKEGLGRHLAYFLEAAQNRRDVRFVIACPNWGRKDILALCNAHQIDLCRFDLISPRPIPGLAFFRRWHRLITKISVSPFLLLWVFIRNCFLRPLKRITYIVRELKSNEIKAHPSRWPHLQAARFREVFFQRLFSYEITRLHRQIKTRKDVCAWYSPTAFWPRFNELPAPRLMCVPDVLITDFPAGFARLSGAAFGDRLREISLAIGGGDHFVTYSDHVKQETLVKKFGVAPAQVDVIRHGTNRMDTALNLPDDQCEHLHYLNSHFRQALKKAVGHPNATAFGHGALKFLFYASQIRPNKNVLTLLRAYHSLLRQRVIGHKLILTGNPHILPEIAAFVREHGLENDVLFLHGLTTKELAVCYKLADIAINPTLFEGGCPFTLTEAVSVGTPVIMSDIPVAREVLTDEALCKATLFDPYDWRALAKHIVQATHNREKLFALQKSFYDEHLAERTWLDVVNDYINLIEGLAEKHRSNP